MAALASAENFFHHYYILLKVSFILDFFIDTHVYVGLGG